MKTYLLSNLKKLMLLPAFTAIAVSCNNSPQEEAFDGYTLVHQNGPDLGYSPNSGVSIIIDKDKAFKDLNKNGVVDRYEDWRLSPQERAKDLAGKMQPQEIAGLMLYSNHQAIKSAELTDTQKKFMHDDCLRHILITTVESPEIAARWNNNAQAFAESLGLGIPANNSSDPRHSADNNAEFNAGGGGAISMWPNELGMGATFDPNIMHRFGEIASTEYRALGFATSLSPQIDIATDPRWMRFNGTYGEDPQLVRDMAVAYCDAFQTSKGEDALYGAWGKNSVNAMVKHWPGGGPGESGRDAHFGRGKYAVYPNNNIDLQKFSFVEGAFKLQEGTDMASAVMPYYTIAYGQSKTNVANNFNQEIIGEQLRKEVGYEGVVCTDWGVTADVINPGIHSGKPWGVESLTVAERHYMAIMAGVDQFGGNDDKEPVLAAFEMLKNEQGEEKMLARIRKSAERLLLNIFRTGLFENPYLNPEETGKIVGNPEYMAAGYDAQLKSIVMLKNNGNTLPLKDSKKLKAYIPERFVPGRVQFFFGKSEDKTVSPVSAEIAGKYFEHAATAGDADIAIVFIDSPASGWGYKVSEALSDPALKKLTIAAFNKAYNQNIPLDAPIDQIVKEDDIYFQPKGKKVVEPKNGYYPISLQYSDYIAEDAREESLAGGDPFEATANRSYKGKGVRTINKCDMELVQQTRKEMGDKPVIVVVNCTNPLVMSEIEPYCDAILVTFSVQNQAILDIVTGKAEPYALLPFQMPANMKTVELQAEDTPRDMDCYVDACGNVYDFAFGLNWSGKINDWRVEKYGNKKY